MIGYFLISFLLDSIQENVRDLWKTPSFVTKLLYECKV